MRWRTERKDACATVGHDATHDYHPSSRPCARKSENIRLRLGAAGAAIVADLLDAIAHDREPLATGTNARDALRVVDAAYASARTGARVDIDMDASKGERAL